MPEQDCKRYVIVDGTTWEDVSSGDDREGIERQTDAMNRAEPDRKYFVRDREERRKIYNSPESAEASSDENLR